MSSNSVGRQDPHSLREIRDLALSAAKNPDKLKNIQELDQNERKILLEVINNTFNIAPSSATEEIYRKLTITSDFQRNNSIKANIGRFFKNILSPVFFNRTSSADLIKAASSIQEKGEFSKELKKHLAWLFGSEDIIKNAVLYPEILQFGDSVTPKTFPSPIMRGIREEKPFIVLKVDIANPEVYLEQNNESLTTMAEWKSKQSGETRSQEDIYQELKKTQIEALKNKQCLIMIIQNSENTVWTNLGNSEENPSFFSERSFEYSLNNINSNVKELQPFFQNLVEGSVGKDGYGNEWKLSA